MVRKWRQQYKTHPKKACSGVFRLQNVASPCSWLFLSNMLLPAIFGPFSVFSTIDFKGKMTHTKGKTLYNLNNNKKRLWKYNDIIQILSDVGVGYRGSFLVLWFRMWVPSGMLTPPPSLWNSLSVRSREEGKRRNILSLPSYPEKHIYVYGKR